MTSGFVKKGQQQQLVHKGLQSCQLKLTSDCPESNTVNHPD